jgi:hypothetical protein
VLLVFVVSFTPSATLFADTVASATTAPVLSVTWPEIEPLDGDNAKRKSNLLQRLPSRPRKLPYFTPKVLVGAKRHGAPGLAVFETWDRYFIGGKYGMYRANSQHRKNTTGM